MALALSDRQTTAPDLTPVQPRRPGLGTRYWQLAGATLASSVGDGLAIVAFPLLAASLTADPRLIAGVAAVQRLPWLVCSIPAGALADRCDRRRLLAVVETARMAILLLLGVAVATHTHSLLLIYVAAFSLGALETAFSGAAQAALPSLVPPEQLTKANGYLLSAQMGGEQFAGPAVGGLVFAAAAALPFVVDGVSFAASAALLYLAIPRRSPDSTRSRPVTTLRSDMATGLRWFVRHPLLRVLAATVAGLAFCQAMGMAVLVLYALQVLHLSKAGFGLFLAAGAIGNVAAGLVAHRLHARVGACKLLVAAGAVTAASYLLIGSTAVFPVALVACLVEALAVGVGNVVTVSLRQSVIPADMLARVCNIFRLCIYGAVPLGALAGGLIAHAADSRQPFIVAGLLQAVLVVPAGMALRRHLGRSTLDG